jgi:hypothetical protein
VRLSQSLSLLIPLRLCMNSFVCVQGRESDDGICDFGGPKFRSLCRPTVLCVTITRTHAVFVVHTLYIHIGGTCI